jgi:short-subunit dehydrogenase
MLLTGGDGQAVAERRVALVTGAVEGLMETLRHEVRPFGIQVALVEPGSIKTPFYARPQVSGMECYAGPRGRAFAAMAEYERNAPGPDVVAAKVVAIADNAHPALRDKVTKEAAQFTLLRRALPPGAFESGVRRAFKLEAKGDAEAKGEAQPQGSVT